jgi:hypothetical protein
MTRMGIAMGRLREWMGGASGAGGWVNEVGGGGRRWVEGVQGCVKGLVVGWAKRWRWVG